MGRLSSYYKEFKLSRDWTKDGMSTTHTTSLKLSEITGITEKK